MTVKVAVTGATANLGRPIFDALLAADYAVTVLTRQGSKPTSRLFQSPDLSVVEVGYSSAPP